MDKYNIKFPKSLRWKLSFLLSIVSILIFVAIYFLSYFFDSHSASRNFSFNIGLIFPLLITSFICSLFSIIIFKKIELNERKGYSIVLRFFPYFSMIPFIVFFILIQIRYFIHISHF